MPGVLDYKKKDKYLYAPPKRPALVEVPPMPFIMVDGHGDPNKEDYRAAVEIQYALAYTIKMSKKGPWQPSGYFDYVVPPLEGLWGSEGPFDLQARDTWVWTSLIRQPEFVTGEVLAWAAAQVRRKKPGVDVGRAYFQIWEEGLCVQMLHIGPYATEPATTKIMHGFMEENYLKSMTGNVRRHHEIYLSDPRKAAPEKLRTILRLPVERM